MITYLKFKIMPIIYDFPLEDLALYAITIHDLICQYV